MSISYINGGISKLECKGMKLGERYGLKIKAGKSLA